VCVRSAAQRLAGDHSFICIPAISDSAMVSIAFGWTALRTARGPTSERAAEKLATEQDSHAALLACAISAGVSGEKNKQSCLWQFTKHVYLCGLHALLFNKNSMYLALCTEICNQVRTGKD
jgi:hypothetical protein